MSSNQNNDPGGSGSSRHQQQQVPSWDEFNMAHEEDPTIGGGGGGNDEPRNDPADLELNQNGDIADGEMVNGDGEEEEGADCEEINEPGNPEEFGPTLPPGFGGDDSQQSAGELLHQPPGGNDLLLNDFSIPIENYDLDVDDPEDPLQCSSSSLMAAASSSSSRRNPNSIGPQLPTSSFSDSPVPPRMNAQRADDHLLLPSINGICNESMNNSGASSSNALHHHISSDFIPCSDPNTSSGSFGHQNRQSDHHQQNSRSAIIGPALPPDLNPIPSCSGSANDSSNQPGTSFPNIDGLDDIGGPSSMMMMMPPDEPQCSSSSALMDDHHPNREDNHHHQNHHLPQQHPGQRKQGGGGGRSSERQIGPTLPSSSEDEEEEEEEEDVEDEEEEVEEVLNGQDEEPIREVELNGIDAELNYAEEQQQEEEEVEEMLIGPMPPAPGRSEDEILIGPMPPAPGRSEDEEQVEYLARLAQFEANKAKASNGVKREEWMTELPQKMLKTGAFGLTATNKTSFSRSGASGEGASTSAAAISAWTSVPNGGQKNGNGPSTSSSHSASTSSAASKPPKRGEQDEWEEQRANQLNADRNVSLMDMHQKKRKIMDPANASDNLLRTSSGERRPFNRDTDMEVRGLGGSDPAALKERMGELSSRFGHSSEKKYL